MSISEGDKLGEYLLIKQIREGVMSRVFKAEHRQTKRIVALKVARTDKERLIRRFQREIELLGRLSHPNILSASDIGQSEGTPYLVYEWIDARDLRTVVRHNGVLRLETALGYVLQVATGLAHAHAKGIIHRDVNPSNLLLDYEDKVLVTDFGLAFTRPLNSIEYFDDSLFSEQSIPKDIQLKYNSNCGDSFPTTEWTRLIAPLRESGDQVGNDGLLTQYGSFLGTPHFMSPEQSHTHKVDHRTDIYGLGCCLYYLVMGHPLYERETISDVIHAHHFDDIPYLEDNQYQTNSANLVFHRMVAKKAVDRYQSMSEVILELEKLLKNIQQKPCISPPDKKDDTPNVDADTINVSSSSLPISDKSTKDSSLSSSEKLNGKSDSTVLGETTRFSITGWAYLEDIKPHNNKERRHSMMEWFAAQYWKPLYNYVRIKGFDDTNAEDIIQGFFKEIVIGRELFSKADPSKGKFRTFLITALNNYVISVQRRDPHYLVEDLADTDPSHPVQSSPEVAIQHQWATSLLEQALELTKQEYIEKGKASHWQVFKEKTLNPILEGNEAPSYSEISKHLGHVNEQQTQNMQIKVRKSLAKNLRKLLKRQIPDDEDVESGVDEVFRILSNKSTDSDLTCKDSSKTGSDKPDLSKQTDDFGITGEMPDMPVEDTLLPQRSEMRISDKQNSSQKEVAVSDSSKIIAPHTVIDKVHFSVTSAPLMEPGASYVVDVWAHLNQQRRDVIERAREEAGGKDIKIKSKGPVRVERGTILAVRLTIQDVIVTPWEDTILWEGEIGNATFSITIKEAAVEGPRAGVARIYANGFQMARLSFVIHIGTDSTKPRCLKAQDYRFMTAFASYARKDEDAVLARVQGLRKALPELNIFYARKDLRSGEKWQGRLANEINTRDIMYLFWSQAASHSKWVDWEWRRGLATRGIDFIDPFPLVSPEIVPPPKELADELHFGDWELAYLGNAR